jgi:hypothetical protein
VFSEGRMGMGGENRGGGVEWCTFLNGGAGERGGGLVAWRDTWRRGRGTGPIGGGRPDRQRPYRDARGRRGAVQTGERRRPLTHRP